MREVKLTNTESLLKSYLGAGEKNMISTKELADKLYGKRKKNRPAHATQSVITMLRSLERKLIRIGSSQRLGFTGRVGPHPMGVWLEKVK